VSDLNIAVVDGGSKRVRWRLVDGTTNHAPHTAWLTADPAAAFVSTGVDYTDDDGNLTLDLEANADITPPGSCWWVEIADKVWVITKTTGPQDLGDALAVDPDALGAMMAVGGPTGAVMTKQADGTGAYVAPVDLAAVTTIVDPAGITLLSVSASAVSQIDSDTVVHPALIQGGSAGDIFRTFDDFEELGANNTTDSTFCSGSGAFAYLFGTVAAVNNVTATEFLPGVIACSTGTATNGRAGIGFSNLVFLFQAASDYRFAMRAKFPVVPNGVNSFEAHIGLAAWASVTLTDAFYFKAVNGTTNWQAINLASSVATTTDTGIAVDTSYHTFDIRWDAGLAAAFYYIDGVQVAQNSAHVPADFTGLTPGAGMFKSAGTSARDLRIDWIYCELPASSRGIDLLA
jgi:hypothetical protein